MSEEKKGDIKDEYSQKAVSLITTEVQDFETGTINLSDKVSFSQYNTIQQIITQQNKGFMTSLAPGQEDDREYYDIVSPMNETGVSNMDLDADNIEPYSDDPEYLAHEYLSRVLLRNYLRRTNHGIILNEAEYQFIDEGNIVARKVDNGEIYRLVLPANLYVIDQSARTLEETTVIEKQVMNQSQVREMKNWANKEKVYEMCNVGDSGLIPFYEIFYRYGEISRESLGYIKKEVHDTPYTKKDDDENNFVQSLIIMAKAKSGSKDKFDNNIEGIIVFAEELKPETIKITKKLEVKRYKPYESARLGGFKGRFWGEGYREIAFPYQNRANEIGNQLRKIMEHASLIAWWSDDDNLIGRNIISSFKRGQIITLKPGKVLNVLNNTFPNFTFFVEEWNRNIDECAKALKAFEVASGENLPSSTSATAISVQNQAVGKYYNFKRERFGLFLTSVFKRWVLPELTKLEEDEIVELSGDLSMIEEMVDAYVNGWMKDNYLKASVMAGQMPDRSEWEQIRELKKQEILKQPKLFITIAKEFFKDIELYVGINTTGEAFNKQSKISNMLQLLQYEQNPAELADTINDIKQMLGIKPSKKVSAPQIQQTPVNTVNLPQKEPSLQSEAVSENSNML